MTRLTLALTIMDVQRAVKNRNSVLIIIQYIHCYSELLRSYGVGIRTVSTRDNAVESIPMYPVFGDGLCPVANTTRSYLGEMED